MAVVADSRIHNLGIGILAERTVHKKYLSARGRKTHIYRAYKLINLNKLLEFSKQPFPGYKLLRHCR